MRQSRKKEHKGFAMLLAIIISSVVLAIGISILDISVNQINLSSSARESELAFQSAHAGIDCMTYWRNEESASYTAYPANTSNPNITCFGRAPQAVSKTRIVNNTSVRAVDRYTYEFDWGNPARCTEISMYVLKPQTANVALNFNQSAYNYNTAVGANGVKTCNRGTVCTVIVSSGYNRSCSEVGSSIFSVQRELTIEF